MRVTLNAARAARNVLCKETHLHSGTSEHEPWCPKLFTGDHEDLSDEAFVVSWEEGVEREWVYDQELLTAMQGALDEYRNTVPAFVENNVTYRLEPVNHWCVAIFAETNS